MGFSGGFRISYSQSRLATTHLLVRLFQIIVLLLYDDIHVLQYVRWEQRDEVVQLFRAQPRRVPDELRRLARRLVGGSHPRVEVADRCLIATALARAVMGVVVLLF